MELGLAALTGFILTVFFEWFPWVAAWFERLEEQGKRAVMLVSLVLVSLALFGLGCIPSSPVHVISCTESGAWDLAQIFFAALVTNQSSHSLVKKKAQ